MKVIIQCNKPEGGTSIFAAKCSGMLLYEGGPSPSDALQIINRFFDEHQHVVEPTIAEADEEVFEVGEVFKEGGEKPSDPRSDTGVAGTY